MNMIAEDIVIPDYMTDYEIFLLYVFWMAVCYHPEQA
jgi:hypothetical protein